MKKKVLIIVGAVVAIGLVGLLIASISSKNRNLAESQQATISAEVSSAEYLKSILTAYYIHSREYPASIDDLEKSVATSESWSEMKPSVDNNLKNLDYSTSDNNQAYKFTYVSVSGDTKEITANYKEDYQ